MITGLLVWAKADVNAEDGQYDPPLNARLKMGAQVLFYFGRFQGFNSVVLLVDSLRSLGLHLNVTTWSV